MSEVTVNCQYSLQTDWQDIFQHVCVIIARHSVADCILVCCFFLVWEVILKKSLHDNGSMAVKHRCLPLYVCISKVTSNSKKGRVLELSHMFFDSEAILCLWFLVQCTVDLFRIQTLVWNTTTFLCARHVFLYRNMTAHEIFSTFHPVPFRILSILSFIQAITRIKVKIN